MRPRATTDHPAFTPRSLVLPDGAVLAYYERPGPGAALVLVPETHGDRTQFYEPAFLERLDRRLRLVVIESRGQGRSWPPPAESQANIPQYADDVLAVVRTLELPQWYVGGHSLGGMIALEIAGRRPPGLRGVAALEGWVHHSVQRHAFPAAPRTEAVRAEARRQREERYRSQRWTAPEYAALGRMWMQWESGPAIVRDLAYPLLSVWGDRGREPRPSRADLQLPASPLIQLHWIAGADHYVTDPPYAAETAAAINRFIAALEAGAGPAPAIVGGGAPERPNFIVIMADDLGYGDLGCFGGRTRTSAIDRLAAEGLRFTDFHSNGAVCSPTRAAFLTGRYQQRSGIVTALGENAAGLPRTGASLAAALRARGYATGLFGKWHLGYHPGNGPLEHGFDTFRGHLHGAFDYFSKVDQYGRRDWWHDRRPVEDETYATDLITAHAVEFIATNRARPFFAFVSHSAIHFPWQAPAGPVQRREGVRYGEVGGPLSKLGPHHGDVGAVVAEMIAALDRSVGAILAAVRSAGLERRTLVLFTSDNGGILSYRGGYANISFNGPLRGAKGSLYEGGHRVPAIAWWPGRITPGTTTAAAAMSMDLMPTFLALAGSHAPVPLPLDGVDLAPVLFGAGGLPARDLFWRLTDRGARAVRRGPWKLVAPPGQPPELYHLDRDLAESSNVAAARPEIATALQHALAAWEQSLPASPAATAGVSP